MEENKMRAPLALGLFATALAGAVPVAAPAQEQGQRIRQVVIYGNDPCPRGTSEEIIVCARRPENERYRIPPETAVPGDNDPNSRSWATRARNLDEVGETGTDSCTPVGPGGQTGCLKEMIDDSRVGMDSDNPSTPE
jgi:hypothetical protein